MSRKNLIVGQSGGPTAVINSSLYGVVSEGMRHPEAIEHVYGMINGIEGFLNGTVLDFAEALPGEKLDGLKVTPGAYLGSCRYKLPESLEDPVYPRLFKKFEEMNIGWFFYIGGNDSMDTVLKLSNYAKSIQSDVKIIGVPKTIDNDLFATDHTPGFGSAAKYVASTVLEIAHDAYIYKIPAVIIIEIMGRDAGWLTASSALARTTYSQAPDLIYLPEVAFSKEQFLADVKDKLTKQKTVIVAVSEGIHDADGNYISSDSAVADKFGHAQLSGAGKALEYLVRDEIGVKVRSIELNVLQRCAGHIASRTDITESFSLGQAAVKYAAEGKTGIMAAIERISNDPYQWVIKSADVADIANEAKSVPVEWINETGNDVTDEMIDYLRPLIIGEVSLQYKDGLPVYLPVDHLLH